MIIAPVTEVSSRANAHWKNQDTDAALKDFSKAVELNSTDQIFA